MSTIYYAFQAILNGTAITNMWFALKANWTQNQTIFASDHFLKYVVRNIYNILPKDNTAEQIYYLILSNIYPRFPIMKT